MSDIKNLSEALAKAQGQVQAAKKTSENPAFSKGTKKSTYADIGEVIEVIQKPASDNGLSVIFNYTFDRVYEGGMMFINYVILHSSGERLEGNPVPMFLRDVTLHGFGASNTFMRRQLLKAIYQIPEEDDDGNTQSNAVPNTAQKPIVPKVIQPKPPPPPAPPKEEKYNPETYFDPDDTQPEPDEHFNSPNLTLKEKLLVLKHKLSYSNEQMSEAVTRVTGFKSTAECSDEDLLKVVNYLLLKLK